MWRQNREEETRKRFSGERYDRAGRHEIIGTTVGRRGEHLLNAPRLFHTHDVYYAYRRIRGISITWHKQYYAKGVHRPWLHSYFDSYSCAKTSPEHNVHLPVYKTIPPICGSSLERLGFKRYHRQPDITTLLCFC